MTTGALTDSQQHVLIAVVQLTNRMGYAPTIRELGTETGWTVSTVYFHLESLRRLGYLRWEPRKPRTIRLTKEPA